MWLLSAYNYILGTPIWEFAEVFSCVFVTLFCKNANCNQIVTTYLMEE